MQDPHVAADGFTYEEKVLREWFDGGHDTSPMTNLKLEHCNLVPNYALRSAIQVRSANKNIEICKLFHLHHIPPVPTHRCILYFIICFVKK